MRLRKLGHSCLLVEEDGRRVLIDPGNLSTDWHGVEGLDALLVTHQHPDHLDLAAIAGLVEANPEMTIFADAGAAGELATLGIEAAAVHDGDVLDVAGLRVTVHGTTHAVIHPDLPGVTNTGFAIGGLFHPGDALTVPPAEAGIRILAAPVVAPWSKVAETIDYLQAAAIPVVVPIHDAILSAAGRTLFRRVLGLAAPGATLRPLDDERDPVEL